MKKHTLLFSNYFSYADLTTAEKWLQPFAAWWSSNSFNTFEATVTGATQVVLQVSTCGFITSSTERYHMEISKFRGLYSSRIG